MDHIHGGQWPEMAKTWPSGAPPASDIDFRTYIVKATMIPNNKWMLEAQSRPFWTMYVARNGQKMDSSIVDMGEL